MYCRVGFELGRSSAWTWWMHDIMHSILLSLLYQQAEEVSPCPIQRQCATVDEYALAQPGQLEEETGLAKEARQ